MNRVKIFFAIVVIIILIGCFYEHSCYGFLETNHGFQKKDVQLFSRVSPYGCHDLKCSDIARRHFIMWVNGDIGFAIRSAGKTSRNIVVPIPKEGE